MRSKNIFSIIILLMVFGFGIYCYFFLQENHNKIYFNNEEIQIESQESSQALNFHYSFFNQAEFYDKAFEDLEPLENTEDDIKGIIVNHHLLAPNLIAEALNAVSSKKAVTVVLISPNHFFAGRGQVVSSLYDWQTPYGILESDKDLIEKMQDVSLLNVEEWPFEKEHGISNIVAFIKKTLPNAKIVPLIVKDTFSIEAGNDFVEKLEKILPEDSLIIASLDFSHYLPSSAADFHDEKSLAVIENFDYEGTKFLDVDSKPTLRILLKYLDIRNASSFHLLGHSNSAKILKDENIFETTSYLTGLFSSGDKIENNKVTLLAFGGLMLDGSVGQAIDESGSKYPFIHIERFLGGSDIVLADLEGSFLDFQIEPILFEKIAFAFESSSVPALKKFGFNVFNLANNHSFDFGKTGLTQSKKHLEKSGIDYFGDSLNEAGISIVKEIRKTKVGFVGYNEFSGMGFEKVVTEIKKIRDEVDFVVAYAHWGSEYQENFSKNQQEKAYQLIDAGADVVFGSHPHAIQPVEVYKNKLIFYSLGSFLFDEAFSSEPQQGLGVGVVFDKPDIEFTLFPTETRNSQIYLMNKEKADRILDELASNSSVSQNMKNQILQGKIKLESQNLLINN